MRDLHKLSRARVVLWLHCQQRRGPIRAGNTEYQRRFSGSKKILICLPTYVVAFLIRIANIGNLVTAARPRWIFTTFPLVLGTN